MQLDGISPAYLQLFIAPSQPETADIPQSPKEFSFRIGENPDSGSDFSRMIKAAQAGDVIARQQVERLNGSAGQGCCGSC